MALFLRRTALRGLGSRGPTAASWTALVACRAGVRSGGVFCAQSRASFSVVSAVREKQRDPAPR